MPNIPLHDFLAFVHTLEGENIGTRGPRIELDEYQIAQADRILYVLLHCCEVSVT